MASVPGEQADFSYKRWVPPVSHLRPGIARSSTSLVRITINSSYDAAGNLLDTQTCAQAGSNHLYTYDAEERLIATSGTTYEYNAAGERVSKDNASHVPQSLYLHDGAGNQIAELNASLAWKHVNVYSGSHLIGTLDQSTGAVFYAYSDWLGTKRYEAGPAGAYTNSWASRGPRGQVFVRGVEFGSGGSKDLRLFLNEFGDTTLVRQPKRPSEWSIS